MKIHNLIKKFALAVAAAATISSAHASADYAPAVWRPAYPGHWYTSGVGKQMYVQHDMEGYYLSTISYLQSGNTSVSVHYCVNGKSDNGTDAAPGEVSQMVLDSNYAWHAVCLNTHSMSTEHEGFANSPAWYTPQMYDASAMLTKSKCEKYGMAKDRNHVVGHGEWQNGAWVNWCIANLGFDPRCNSHTDPGPYWDWTGFMSRINGQTFMTPSATGNGTSPNPGTANNADGRLEIFGSGSAGALWHVWETSNNGPWSSWASFGGTQYSQVVAGKHADGRIETFVIGANNALFSYAIINGAWNGPASFPGAAVTSVTVGNSSDGRIELFAAGTDGALWHMWETSNNGPWSSWQRFGETGVTKVALGRHNDGRLEVFYIATGGAVGAYSQASAPAGAWSKSTTLPGGTMTSLAVANNPDGRLEIFGTGVNGALWHFFETSNNGPWSTWQSFGESGLTQVVLWPHAGQRLEAFYLGSGGFGSYAVINGFWTKSTAMPAISLTSLFAGSHQGGRIELVGRGTDGLMKRLSETSPNGAWTPSWESWPGSPSLK
ncbi:MAG: putative peptidoglycan binding protein [Verrucomicrobiales bacterium]|nr:putative peptidoglycan binding protein [Verrucomicrobiales bacterium]